MRTDLISLQTDIVTGYPKWSRVLEGEVMRSYVPGVVSVLTTKVATVGEFVDSLKGGLCRLV